MRELIVSEFDMFAALDTIDVCHEYIKTQEDEITRLRAQLEAGEAVAWVHPDHLDLADLDVPVRFTAQSKPWGSDSIPLYTRPAPVVPEWISVEDQLPNPAKDTAYAVIRSGRVTIEEWEVDYQQFEQMHASITHWMTLPSPLSAAQEKAE